MDAKDILTDAAQRSTEVCRQLLEDLTPEEANRKPAEGTNPITWLIWHIAREQDAQVAELNGGDEVWVSGGWADRFGLDLPTESMGFGHSSSDVDKVRVTDLSLLRGYLDAAAAATANYLASLSQSDLDDVVDEQWDPPVTRGARLVSVIDDAAQHAGQAAYVRGLLGAS